MTAARWPEISLPQKQPVFVASFRTGVSDQKAADASPQWLSPVCSLAVLLACHLDLSPCQGTLSLLLLSHLHGNWPPAAN